MGVGRARMRRGRRVGGCMVDGGCLGFGGWMRLVDWVGGG